MNPGKFEGEPDYVSAFWASALEGRANEDRDGTYIFHITQEDNQKFPELPVGAKLYLVESNDGFVHSSLIPPIRVTDIEVKLVRLVKQLQGRGIKFDAEYLKRILDEAAK